MSLKVRITKRDLRFMGIFKDNPKFSKMTMCCLLKVDSLERKGKKKYQETFQMEDRLPNCLASDSSHKNRQSSLNGKIVCPFFFGHPLFLTDTICSFVTAL